MERIEGTGREDGRASFAPLSRRESEVARLIAGGATNRQIANALVLTEGTVANHVRRALVKLGLSSRTQLAVWAVRRSERAEPLLGIDAGQVGLLTGANCDETAARFAEQVVFVVGDDRAARGALTGALVSALGLRVVSVSGGEAVTTWARVLQPSIVLVDARPGHLGWSDVVRRLRADTATSSTRVLAVGRLEPAGALCDVLADDTPGTVVAAVLSRLVAEDGSQRRPSDDGGRSARQAKPIA